jgi:hypothetical protein
MSAVLRVVGQLPDLYSDDCLCCNTGRYYCDAWNDNIQNFKDMCEAWGEGWYWDEC